MAVTVSGKWGGAVTGRAGAVHGQIVDPGSHRGPDGHRKRGAGPGGGRRVERPGYSGRRAAQVSASPHR